VTLWRWVLTEDVSEKGNQNLYGSSGTAPSGAEVHAIHPSGLPLACNPRMGLGSSGFPLCSAPRCYRRRTTRRGRAWARDVRDEQLKKEVMRVWQDRRKGREVYGAPKVWRQLRREGVEVARCTVERLCDTKSQIHDGQRQRRKLLRCNVEVDFRPQIGHLRLSSGYVLR
jgi:hypothetical protein